MITGICFPSTYDTNDMPINNNIIKMTKVTVLCCTIFPCFDRFL